jgi:Tfp pilus assembly protein PilW
MSTKRLTKSGCMKSERWKTPSRQHGASLLEGIAYLGIAALVILGAVSLLAGAFSSAQTNRGAEEVVSIRTGVKKLYMGQSAAYAAGSMNATLVAANVFPTTLAAAADGTVTNTWGGTVAVTGAGATFTVSYAAVPKDACINMMSAASGWLTVKVGSHAARPTPVAPDVAVTDCDATANTIVWTAT